MPTPLTANFPLPLILVDNCNGTYDLAADFEFRDGPDALVLVPKGFTTDFLSIPMILTNFLPRDWKYGRAGVIHDKLYSDAAQDRQWCDALLRRMLLLLGCPVETADIVYAAVRDFGGSHWGKAKTPENPTGTMPIARP